MSSTHDASSSAGPESSGGDRPRKAGAFDIRNFIAMLIGLYGVILVIAGLIGPSEAELAKTGGLNINLIAGIGMVAVAAVFLLWARLRPVVVPDHVGDEEPPVTGH